MIFEIVKDGQTVFVTEHKECIFPSRTLRTMSKAGYTFRLNGKRVSAEKINSL